MGRLERRIDVSHLWETRGRSAELILETMRPGPTVLSLPGRLVNDVAFRKDVLGFVRIAQPDAIDLAPPHLVVGDAIQHMRFLRQFAEKVRKKIPDGEIQMDSRLESRRRNASQPITMSACTPGGALIAVSEFDPLTTSLSTRFYDAERMEWMLDTLRSGIVALWKEKTFSVADLSLWLTARGISLPDGLLYELAERQRRKLSPLTHFECIAHVADLLTDTSRDSHVTCPAEGGITIESFRRN
jgi:hypothetical protein